MNANTRLRLWKETRALLPMWGAMAGLIAVPFLLRQEQPMRIALPAFWLGCAVLGPVVIGQEFQHRTMANLLAQPVSRRRVWWEKMVALSTTMIFLFLWVEALWSTEVGAIPVFSGSPELVLNAATLLLLPMLVGFCSGPVFTLLARSILGGVALTFLCPWFLFMLGILLVPRYWLSHGGTQLELNGWIVAVGFYSATLLLYGCRRFARLEDVNLLAQEFAAPRQFDSLFARLTAGLAPERGSMMANLVRKELRVQRPAFFVAAFLIALWLALLAAWKIRPEFGAGLLFLPSVLLCLGIPIIVGSVSTAEERSLGVHEWHMTLPVSARRQFGVKVLVALGVNAVLGLLLPSLLGHALRWFSDVSHLTGEMTGSLSVFAIANLAVLFAACFASTFSPNGIRALMGTLVLLTVVSLVYAYVLKPMNSHHYPPWAWARALGQGSAAVIPPERLLPTLQWYGYARLVVVSSGILLLGWLVWRAALSNYRRGAAPCWVIARQVGCLALAVCGFWFLPGFVLQILGGLFEATHF